MHKVGSLHVFPRLLIQEGKASSLLPCISGAQNPLILPRKPFSLLPLLVIPAATRQAASVHHLDNCGCSTTRRSPCLQFYCLSVSLENLTGVWKLPMARVPVVAQRKQIWLGSTRSQVQSPASISGLRIWHCHELWCRSTDTAQSWCCCGDGVGQWLQRQLDP